MSTPKHCPYCFGNVERTRYWYRDAHDIEPASITPPECHADLPGMAPIECEMDEMVMVMPCGHSFEAGRWFDYAEACQLYTFTLDELSQVISTGAASVLSEDLDAHDITVRMSAEECCETMERTAPSGVF